MRGPALRATALLLAVLVVPAPATLADTPAKLLIGTPAYAVSGGEATVLGTLRASAGLPQQTIDIWVDGVFAVQAVTDTSGAFSVDVPMPARVGVADVHATWLSGLPVEERSNTRRIGLALPPDAPGDVDVREDAQRAVVTWAAPATDGGAAILGYVVWRDGPDGTKQLADLGATARTYADATAATSESYSYWVVARNGAASGPPSDQVAILMRPAAPPASAIWDAARAMGILQWARPSGSVAPIAYHLQRDGVDIASPGADVLLHEDGPLPPSARYAYGVAAENAAGLGPAAVVTLVTPPGAPRELVGEAPPGVREVHLQWSPPAETGPAPPTGYVVERRLATTPWQPLATTSASTWSLTDTGVQWSERYAYRVLARNEAGEGNASATVAILTRPPAPTASVAFDAERAAAVIQWSAPPGSEPLTGYRVQKDGAAVAQLGPDVLSHEDGPLPLSSRFTYGLAAENAAGAGAETLLTLVTPPGEPLGLAAEAPPGVREIRLRWDAPAEAGPAPPTAYAVERLDNGAWRLLGTTNASTLDFTDASVEWSDVHDYRVRARNEGGHGNASVVQVQASANLLHLDARLPQLQVCARVDGEEYEQCATGFYNVTFRYSTDQIWIGPRAHGHLYDSEGNDIEGELLHVHATISWDGAVHGAASKDVYTYNMGYADTFVYPTATWNDLPYGECRDATATITLTYEDLSASASHTWPICHDL